MKGRSIPRDLGSRNCPRGVVCLDSRVTRVIRNFCFFFAWKTKESTILFKAIGLLVLRVKSMEINSNLFSRCTEEINNFTSDFNFQNRTLQCSSFGGVGRSGEVFLLMDRPTMILDYIAITGSYFKSRGEGSQIFWICYGGLLGKRSWYTSAT